ncbi:MAG TPA: heavy metal-binding domain-containing protein, partial [Solirubrobacteraceae bacterium]|nr:heavy metal-binding domain-containing protein [Solirubrobacteraceae bacterium]
MEQEADQLGADGVVGVRLEIGRYEWGADLAEFVAVGTAVKHREGKLHRAPNGRPFTSDLSGQDFSILLRTGYRPVGLVMGNCVYHVAHQSMRQAWKQIGRNQEMPNFTQALYEARELAQERMQNEAEELQARGIVGARIVERSHGWGSHVIEFFAVGTAVVPAEDEVAIQEPTLVLPLTDGG